MTDLEKLEAERLFAGADNFIKEQNMPAAMQELQYIIQMYPEFGKSYNHLAWIYETKLSNLPKAEELYKLCIKYDPNYKAAYLNYAVVLSTTRRYKELETLLSQALQVPNMDLSTIYNEYAIMYEVQGHYELAIENYKKNIAGLFNDNSIQTALNSIERCKKKMDIFNRS
jgi:tetratricopeptide (TPR) repeat protein